MSEERYRSENWSGGLTVEYFVGLEQLKRDSVERVSVILSRQAWRATIRWRRAWG